MSIKDRARKGSPQERRRSDRPYVLGLIVATLLIATVGVIGVALTRGSASIVTVVLVAIAVGGILTIPVLALLDRKR